MISLERTHDSSLIRSIVERVRAEVMEGDTEIPVPEDAIYLVASEMLAADGALHNEPVGLIAFMLLADEVWNPHVVILKPGRGYGTDMVRDGCDWIARNKSCASIFARPPAFKRSMIRVFEKCGFKHEGVLPSSFSWRGELHDRVLMRKEMVCGLH